MIRSPAPPVLLLLTLTGALPAQESADPQALVRELGSDDWNLREEAARRLTAIGFPARQALLAATSSEDIEVARAARTILGRIDREYLGRALASADALRDSLRVSLGLDEEADPLDRLLEPTAEDLDGIHQALVDAGPSREGLFLALFLYQRGEEESRSTFLDTIFQATAACPDEFPRALGDLGPAGAEVLGELLEAAALPDQPYPARGLVEALCRSAPAGGADVRRQALELLVAFGDPSLLPLLVELGPAGAGSETAFRAARAFLGDAQALDEALADLPAVEDGSVRTRILEALILSPPRALPAHVLEAALRGEDVDAPWAAAAVMRHGTADEARRAIDALAAAERSEAVVLGNLLEAHLRPEWDPASLALLGAVFMEEETRPVHLVSLTYLIDSFPRTGWELEIRRGLGVPFASLEPAWPTWLARMADARAVPLLRSTIESNLVEERVAASSLRALLEGHPEEAVPTVRYLLESLYNPLRTSESRTLLEWAARTRGPDAYAVASELLSSWDEIDVGTQQGALALLEDLGGEEAMVAIERFFLTSSFDASDARVVQRALRACRKLGGPRAFGLFANVCRRSEDMAFDVLVEGLSGLAALGPEEPATVELLSKVAAEGYDFAVLRTAVDALVELSASRPEARTAALLSLEFLDSVEVAEQDEESVAGWTETVVERLAATSAPEDHPTWVLVATGYAPFEARERAVRWLGDLEPELAVPALWQVALHDEEGEARDLALDRLRRTTGLDLDDYAQSDDLDSMHQGRARLEAWLAKR